MRTTPFAAETIACFCLVAGIASAEPETRPIESKRILVFAEQEPLCAPGAPQTERTPLPRRAEVWRHQHSLQRGRERTTEVIGNLQQSNADGSVALTLGGSRGFAGEGPGVVHAECLPDRIEILLTCAGDGMGPACTADVAPYDGGCPGEGGELIPGTAGSIALPDDGLHLITLDLEGINLPMPGTYWVHVQFDTGIHPTFCLPADCPGDPPSEFIAYYNPELTGPIFAPGAGQWMADDMRLIVDDCELSSLEVAVAGADRDFTMDVQLWQSCDPDSVIDATQRTYAGDADCSVETVRFDFEPGSVTLASDQLWIAWRFNEDGIGPIIAHQAILGFSDDMFGLWNPTDGCDYYWFSGSPYAAFNATVRCFGEPPSGACCDLTGSDEEFCFETPEIGCTNRLARWSREKACDDPTAFDPPCGHSACCMPCDKCENLTAEDCAAITDEDGNPAIWQRGQFCGEGEQRCLWFQCWYSDGPCDIAHSGKGCENPVCCDKICAQDPYCCYVHWDSQCADRANADPPDGCDLPVSNDECLNALSLEEYDECGAENELCMEQNNGGATPNSADPGFCCHPAGPGAQGVGSVWYTFVATHDSARIDTCSTTGAGDRADDSLIQVYKVLDPSGPQGPCPTLVPLACNDDFPLCGPQGDNSRLDVFALVPDQTYYIQLAAKTSSDTGKYRLRVTMPSPAAVPYPPPDNNYCATASPAAGGDTYFQLDNATMDCPFEPQVLPGMQNDVWFEYVASGSVLVVVETCSPDTGSDPDTTLAVYQAIDCPVDPDSRVACNDDAEGDCGAGSRVFLPVNSGDSYKIRVGGKYGGEPSGWLTIASFEDCQGNLIPDPCDIDCGPVGGLCDMQDCGQSTDINGDGIPDECVPVCLDGYVEFIEPPNGFIDARQPHLVNDATALQGVDTFVVAAPDNADFDGGACWSLCETNDNPGMHLDLSPNSIVSVADNGDCTYTVTLDRAITPGELTMITYSSSTGATVAAGTFTFLPGDADGDRTAAPADILAVIDSLNNVVALPVERADMDRDGTPAPADMLRVIDLLNGAGAFQPWLDVAIGGAGCP
jgi:hypothetical protein